MVISTSYLGFDLPNPFIAGAGPLSDTPQHAKQVEDAGAAAIVMHSLFEEQVGETASSQPSSSTLSGGVVAQYLEQLCKLKEAVDVPVFASMNGHTPGPWLDAATALEQAGADALELNVYYVATDAEETAVMLEQRAVDMVAEITRAIKIPLAVKLSPFYTSLAHFARNLEQAGAVGLVLFNRSFAVDIDVGMFKVLSNRELSKSNELLLRLRWLSVLASSLDSAKLAVSGGVHSGEDAIKAFICGASAVQMVSALLKNGPGHLSKVREELMQWMEHHEYESLEQMRSSVNISRTRTDYMRLLQSWERLYSGRD
ncbi:MAG: dihydroorotate dehydrogenase-like protein [bacterium]